MTEALRAGLGIAPEDVTDIIVSHSHWDHVDGVGLFPKAVIHIQKEEYEYSIGPQGEMLHGGGVDADGAAMLAALKAAGRVRFVDGDAKEMLPGIMLQLAATPALVVPGHDPAVFDRFPQPGRGVARIDR